MYDEHEPYQDIEISCVGCKAQFQWTKGEQRFLQGLLDEGKMESIKQPKRCKDCRMKKKEERGEQ